MSLEEEAVEAAKDAAAIEGMSLSAWLSDVALLAAKRTLGLRAVDDYEAEFGPLTEEELQNADAVLDRLGYGPYGRRVPPDPVPPAGPAGKRT